MVELTLPQNSKIKTGKTWEAPAGSDGPIKTFRIYRYDPASGENYKLMSILASGIVETLLIIFMGAQWCSSRGS